MQIFRTTGCAAVGHPEFTVVFAEKPPSPSIIGGLLDMLEQAVTQGSSLCAGMLFPLGWRVLRIIDRQDGTLGLEERVVADFWEEHVDQAMGDLWWQTAAAAKLGLPVELSSIGEEQAVAVQSCAYSAGLLILHRLGPDTTQPGEWGLRCGVEHEHADWTYLDLHQLSVAFPFVTQFLALPPETGLLIERDRVEQTGGLMAEVAYQDTMVTPDGGMHFGPAPEPLNFDLWARFAIGQSAPGLYRTTIGAEYRHPEIVARLSEPALPDVDDVLVDWVLDDLQRSISTGTRFTPGERIQVGWRTLRIVARADGLLGLHERVSTDAWAEHVELTLRETWYQKEVAASLGLTEDLDFPTEHQSAAVASCVHDRLPALVLARDETDDARSSGWRVHCAQDHEHGAWSSRTLWEITDFAPFATQFLALPKTTSLTVEAPHTTPSGRIRTHITLGGRHRVPNPGSYLAVLNAAS
ncbi:hypothetical protein [Nocardia vulneris]|uniref:Uncharacterized protein n=1 Tax=Nocardia vulneris TaxID=1141657 RepID=A0ABR4Z7A4_9NOCA|nr:hypothetical protein [Nocardia vulneris]KIA61152.1 hypothetical protein FG87_32490 [Nocardia vulneris]